MGIVSRPKPLMAALLTGMLSRWGSALAGPRKCASRTSIVFPSPRPSKSLTPIPTGRSVQVSMVHGGIALVDMDSHLSGTHRCGLGGWGGGMWHEVGDSKKSNRNPHFLSLFGLLTIESFASQCLGQPRCTLQQDTVSSVNSYQQPQFSAICTVKHAQPQTNAYKRRVTPCCASQG